MKLTVTMAANSPTTFSMTFENAGLPLLCHETTDVDVLLIEVRQRLCYMRHIAKGKVFETKEPKSNA